MEETTNGAQAVVLVPARMDTRVLPGKPLLPLGSATVLEQIFRRVTTARFGSVPFVVTTDTEPDRPLRDFCAGRGIRCLTETNGDMVEAALQAAEITGAQVVVFCPDNRPLVSPRMLDACARYACDAGMDYVTVGRLPAGAAPEAIPTSTLRRIALMTRASEHRQRVTEFAAAHPALFERAYLPSPPRLARPDVRLLLETEEDYRLLSRIYAEVAPGPDGLLSIEDILTYLNADIMELRRAA